jgi:hypothetical protein
MVKMVEPQGVPYNMLGGNPHALRHYTVLPTD